MAAEDLVITKRQQELITRVLNDFQLVLEHGAGGVYRKQIQSRIEKVEELLGGSDGKEEKEI